jgi:hypothetical protein
MSAIQQEISETNGGPGGAKVTPIRRRQPAATVERIAPELNLEKWSIWQPAHSTIKETRTLKRTITRENGESLTSQVVIGYVDKIGTITTEDKKTYYALIKYWEDAGRIDRPTFFSLKRLAKILRKKWGSNVIDALTQSLTRLRATPLIWTNSYYDSTAGKTREVIDTFNILADLKIIRTREHGHITKEAGYFRFNDQILRNLLADHTKPLLLETILSFKSEVALILYTYLDLILADKTKYERRTKELFEDLGLEGKAYQNAANRKQKLKSALNELEGTPLTTGRIASATLERTKDGKDYKIVICKGPRQVGLESPQAKGKEIEQGRGEQPPQEPESPPIKAQADELVRHFYQIFHGREVETPQSPAVDQAITLIAQYGVERAKYIIIYAHQEAPKTNFKIKTFGGVMQYQHEALEHLERTNARLRQAEIAQAQEEERHRQEEEARARAKARLDSLSPEQYQQLYEKVKAEVFNRASGWITNRPDGAILEGTIRAGMIAELEHHVYEQPSETQTA